MRNQGVLPFHNKSRAERTFDEWIETRDGKRVEAECVTRARRLREHGVKRYSIDALFHSVRFDWTVGLIGDEEYRLNNNHHPFMSRRIMGLCPDLADFFETRELTAVI